MRKCSLLAPDQALGANGPPGLRPEYTGHYYAAFVLDPDGNNVEAVFHAPISGGSGEHAGRALT